MNISIARPILPPCKRFSIGLRELWLTTARVSSSDGVGAAMTPAATARAENIVMRRILAEKSDGKKTCSSKRV